MVFDVEVDSRSRGRIRPLSGSCFSIYSICSPPGAVAPPCCGCAGEPLIGLTAYSALRRPGSPHQQCTTPSSSAARYLSLLCPPGAVAPLIYSHICVQLPSPPEQAQSQVLVLLREMLC